MSNVDLAPTLAGLAGATLEGPVDGVDSTRILRGGRPTRKEVLLESVEFSNAKHADVPSYCGLRSARRMYVRYATGEEEFYDLRKDPYQLENVADQQCLGWSACEPDAGVVRAHPTAVRVATVSGRMAIRRRSVALPVALAACAALASIFASVVTPSVPQAEAAEARGGLGALDHLIFIVQENRSFDHYFGTYPGADGIPTSQRSVNVCLPNPTWAVAPGHTTPRACGPLGGPHNQRASTIDDRRRAMNGFIRALPTTPNACWSRSDHPRADRSPARAASPTSWATTQDGRSRTTGRTPRIRAAGPMFAPRFVDAARPSVPGVGLVGQLPRPPSDRDVVQVRRRSGARRRERVDLRRGARCTSGPTSRGCSTRPGVVWGYYVARGTCRDPPCPGSRGGAKSNKNPLPGFTDVWPGPRDPHDNILSHDRFITAARNGNLPRSRGIAPWAGVQRTSGGVATCGPAWPTSPGSSTP